MVQRKVILRQLVYLMFNSRFNLIKIILIAFLFSGFSSEFHARMATTIVKNCYDGDTCTTIDGERIRLACIDTPEIKGKKADPIPAKEARDFLNNLLVNKKVSIKRITKDRYGRTVGELFKNGLNIQKMIVEKGHGKIYEKYSHQCTWTRK